MAPKQFIELPEACACLHRGLTTPRKVVCACMRARACVCAPDRYRSIRMENSGRIRGNPAAPVCVEAAIEQRSHKDTQSDSESAHLQRLNRTDGASRRFSIRGLTL